MYKNFKFINGFQNPESEYGLLIIPDIRSV